MISNWKLDQAAGDGQGQPAYSQGITNVQPVRETPRVGSKADMWIRL
jgi:hypothetical protein